MQLDLSKLQGWELTKAIYLIKAAKKLCMNFNCYGEIDVNPSSGYTYLWLEDYPFTLYMEIDCRLNDNDVWVMYTNLEDGEETERRLSEFDNIEEIYDWAESLETNNY